MKKLSIVLIFLFITIGFVFAKTWSPIYPIFLSLSTPRVSSATVSADGVTLTVVYSEAITNGSEYDDGDLDLDAATTGDDITVSYASGDTTATHVYDLGDTVVAAEACNLDFNGDTNSLENLDSNDVAAIVSLTVTNSSAQ